MILGIGSDIVNIQRIERLCKTWDKKFETRIFTPHEIATADTKKTPLLRFSSLAKRFAAKEAFAKAIGTGIGRVSWQDIEVRNDARGKPILVLYGNALTIMEQLTPALSVIQIDISLSDEYPMAMAFVIISARS